MSAFDPERTFHVGFGYVYCDAMRRRIILVLTAVLLGAAALLLTFGWRDYQMLTRARAARADPGHCLGRQIERCSSPCNWLGHGDAGVCAPKGVVEMPPPLSEGAVTEGVVQK